MSEKPMTASFMDNPGNGIVRQMVQLGLHRGEWRSHVYRDLSAEEATRAALQIEGARNIGLVLSQAERARDMARSYRNFRVGAAGLAGYYGAGTPLSIEVLLGANAKPVSGSDIINIHAEHEVMIQAMERRLPQQEATIPLFAVVGDLQPDQQTGLETPTLHPCGVCRDAFLEDETPITPDSICVTANPTFTEFEWFSVRSLIAHHEGVDGVRRGGASFSSRPLALSFDLPQRGDEPFDLAELDTDEMLASDREVALKLQYPLLQFVLDSINEPTAGSVE